MNENDSPVTLRELLAEIRRIEGHIETAFTKHNAEHAQHELEHRGERRQRLMLTLWGVTTVVTASGVLVALFAAMKG